MRNKLLLVLCLALTSVPASFSRPARNIRLPHSECVDFAEEAPKRVRVAFLVSEDAVVIDFAGPWEVFQDVMIPSNSHDMDDAHPFELYTVSESKGPIRVTGGLRIVPGYTLDNAPKPDVVVVPEQGDRSPAVKAWLRKMASEADYVISICTGAFILADAGLLDGKKATTHHAGYTRLHARFPAITVERGRRYVQADQKLFTSGGLSSGIELALHIVELYFGRSVAAATARHMEFADNDWIDGVATVDFAAAIETAAYPSDSITTGFPGKWRGTLVIPDGKFEVVLHIWPDKDNRLGGVIESVNEDSPGLPLAAVTVNADHLRFEVPSVGGSYEGTINSKQSVIRGSWTKAGATSELVLTRVLPVNAGNATK